MSNLTRTFCILLNFFNIETIERKLKDLPNMLICFLFYNFVKSAEIEISLVLW